MNDVVALAAPVGAGALLGVLFFGGLLWTVRRGLCSRHVARWFLVSLLLRTGVTLAGFLVVSAGEWKRLLACLLGFVGARFLVARLSAPPVEIPHSSGSRTRHAP